MSLPNLRIEGMMVGRTLLTNFMFDPGEPHTYCRICGALFQQDTDRHPENYTTDDLDLLDAIAFASSIRKNWSVLHAKTHSEKEHRELEVSKRWLTAEAAYVLAPCGVFSLTDAVLDEEVEDALKSAPRAPINDALSRR